MKKAASISRCKKEKRNNQPSTWVNLASLACTKLAGKITRPIYTGLPIEKCFCAVYDKSFKTPQGRGLHELTCALAQNYYKEQSTIDVTSNATMHADEYFISTKPKVSRRNE